MLSPVTSKGSEALLAWSYLAPSTGARWGVGSLSGTGEREIPPKSIRLLLSRMVGGGGIKKENGP